MELNTQTIVILAAALALILYLSHTGQLQLGGGAVGLPSHMANFGAPDAAPYNLSDKDAFPQPVSCGGNNKPCEQCGGNPHGVPCDWVYPGAKSDASCIGYNGYKLERAYGTDAQPSGYKA
jgi:hypothetical protein